MMHRDTLRIMGCSAILVLLTTVCTELPSPAQATKEIERAKALYRGHCAACHGIDGNGAGPKATGLTPPPTNFRNRTLMNAMQDGQIERAILAGKAGTAMKGYGTILNPQDVAALVKYLRLLPSTP